MVTLMLKLYIFKMLLKYQGGRDWFFLTGGQKYWSLHMHSDIWLWKGAICMRKCQHWEVPNLPVYSIGWSESSHINFGSHVPPVSSTVVLLNPYPFSALYPYSQFHHDSFLDWVTLLDPSSKCSQVKAFAVIDFTENTDGTCVCVLVTSMSSITNN